MIDVRGVTKWYGDKVAVDDVTFSVRPGIVTGFVGPNGAGKSTLMRLIIGLDAPNAGTVTVNGRAYRDHAAPLHEVGAMLEARAIHPGRSAVNHLLPMAQTHGIPRARVTRSSTSSAFMASRANGWGRSHWECFSAWGSRPHCSEIPPRWCWTNRPMASTRRDPLDPHPAERPRRRGPSRLCVLPPHERDGHHRGPPHRHRPGPSHRRYERSRVRSRGLDQCRARAHARRVRLAEALAADGVIVHSTVSPRRRAGRVRGPGPERGAGRPGGIRQSHPALRADPRAGLA